MIEVERPQDLGPRGPFIVNESHTIHDEAGMQLIRDRVTNPDGSKGERYRVDFPNEAVLVFPMDEQNNLYLIEEFAYATNEYKIEAAGGIINPGETPEEAALRKAREELGVEIEMESLTRIPREGPLQEITSRVRNNSHTFMAKVKELREPVPNAGDDITRKVYPLAVAVEMARTGKINTGVINDAILLINDLINIKTLVSIKV